MPGRLDNPRETARLAFDQVVDPYDSARPGYPRAAVVELATRCKLAVGSVVLEIGCGTGQLTRSLAALGARLRCLEPGPRLARRALANLEKFSNVEVVERTFEDAAEPSGAFDAVISGTAIHWVAPALAFSKSAKLLRAGGALGLLTNVHGSGGSHAVVTDEVRALHRELAPEMGTWQFPSVGQIEKAARQGGDIAEVWARVERTFEAPPSVGWLFEPPFVAVYPWLAEYDVTRYLELLASQSSYALMEPARRSALLARIGECVDRRLDGLVTKEYVTVLAVARRR